MVNGGGADVPFSGTSLKTGVGELEQGKRGEWDGSGERGKAIRQGMSVSEMPNAESED